MTGILFLIAVRDFSLLHSVQTSPGTHPVSYSMGTRSSSRGMELTTQLHLVLRSGMVVLYLCSCICFHRIVLNYIIENRDNLSFTFTWTFSMWDDSHGKFTGHPHLVPWFKMHGTVLSNPCTHMYVQLSTCFHLMLMLRMNRVYSCPSQYIFVEWRVTWE
jgi:hypothetical protein